MNTLFEAIERDKLKAKSLMKKRIQRLGELMSLFDKRQNGITIILTDVKISLGKVEEVIYLPSKHLFVKHPCIDTWTWIDKCTQNDIEILTDEAIRIFKLK